MASLALCAVYIEALFLWALLSLICWVYNVIRQEFMIIIMCMYTLLCILNYMMLACVLLIMVMNIHVSGAS